MQIEVRWQDMAVLAAYLLGMAAMGVYFARKNETTEQYFVGDRSFKGWVLGLSMLGTSISSVTFLAFPAAAYVRDWRQLVMNLMLPAAAVLAVVVFIPFFRRGNLTSAFEYLGERFGPVVRLYGTLSFILLQLIRLGKVLFLVSIPVALLTGADTTHVIVAVGVFIALYTVLGGIGAVIWTDVIQAFVLWGGGIVCLVYIALALPEGLGQIIEVGVSHNKFHLGGMKWSLSERTFWTVALLGLYEFIGMYAKDQNMVQRYAAARSTHDARRATIIYSIAAVPTWTFFFFLGTSVFVFYKVLPDPAVAGLQADEVFPYFILTQIPAGIAGLVIAGVLAAAMSSLDSSINAVSTLVTVDLMKPYLARNREDRFYLKWARVIATITSGVMIAGAVLFSSVQKESMNDLSWIMASVFGGCLLGVFMLGFFTTRVDNTAVLIALIFAVAANVYLGVSAAGRLPEAWRVPIHEYWIGPLVNAIFVVIALAACIIPRESEKNLEGLTVWTMPHYR